jgi:hypothetical protein
VTRIVASYFKKERAYATLDGHRNDDFIPYVFVTEDFGENWEKISHNLSEGSIVNLIREHFRNPNLLFIGTERGAYFSVYRGKSWIMFKGNLPIVPVDDIAIHPRDNDLIFGTHGRSIWILDDITCLKQLTEDTIGSPVYLFDIRKAEKILMLASSIEGYSGAPAEEQLKKLKTGIAELNSIVNRINKMIEENIPQINKLMSENNIQHLLAPEQIVIKK